jgi:hypothetical protein
MKGQRRMNIELTKETATFKKWFADLEYWSVKQGNRDADYLIEVYVWRDYYNEGKTPLEALSQYKIDQQDD